MNINFGITEKIGKIVPTHGDCYWQEANSEEGTFSFCRLVWRLWKWYSMVKRQAKKANRMRKKDRSMYVFRTRQIFRIETEN